MVTFQRDINSNRNRSERFYNRYWYIQHIPMEWNHFQTKQLSTKLWKNVLIYHFTDKPIFVVATFSVILIWSSSDWKHISTQV